MHFGRGFVALIRIRRAGPQENFIELGQRGAVGQFVNPRGQLGELLAVAAIIGAANESGLTPKMLGGAMIGMLITPIRVQLGPIANGLVISETFLPSPKLQFDGLADVMKRYQARAGDLKTDPIGYAFVPIGYSAGQVLAKAVTETKSLDHDKLAAYVSATQFDTVLGKIKFAKDGEWTEARQFTTQVQNVIPNNLDQFRDGSKTPVLWPLEYKSGDLIYPYADARKK
ncbi:MAG: ABC transporter substrate-binding protein [Hyphomicrobiales bacterium]